MAIFHCYRRHSRKFTTHDAGWERQTDKKEDGLVQPNIQPFRRIMNARFGYKRNRREKSEEGERMSLPVSVSERISENKEHKGRTLPERKERTRNGIYVREESTACWFYRFREWIDHISIFHVLSDDTLDNCTTNANEYKQHLDASGEFN